MQKSENDHGSNKLKQHMPCIGHLKYSLRPKRDLGQILGMHKLPSGRGRQIADGFVRLAEKSAIEYVEARAKLFKFLELGNADDEYRAGDHFESCIQSLHRAINYLERLKSLGYKRGDGSPLVPKPQNMTVLHQSNANSIRDFRDAIEHLENDILKGLIPETQRTGVHLGWDKATIGSHNLGYKEVAKWIEQINRVAAILSEIYVTVSSNQTGK